MTSSTKEYEMTKIMFISIFLTMFMQIVDTILNVNLSLVGIAVFFIGAIYTEVKFKKINKKILVVCLLVALETYMIMYNESNMIQVLYPILFSFLIFIYVFEYFELDFYMKNIIFIRNILCVYLIFNIFMYLSKNQLFIQDDGFMRYKGALPHSNMLSALLFCFLFINSIKKDNIKIVVDILVFILIFVSASRLYIIATIIIYVLVNCKDYNDSSKRNKITVAILIIATIVYLLYNGNIVYGYLTNTDVYRRMMFLNDTSNGRDNLMNNFKYIFNSSNRVNRLFGGNMASEYYALTNNSFSHSFGENSILSITISFGIVGLIAYIGIFVAFIVRLGRENKLKTILNVCIILVMLSTTYFQDVVLSTQLFTMYMISMCIVKNNTYSIKNKKGDII